MHAAGAEAPSRDRTTFGSRKRVCVCTEHRHRTDRAGRPRMGKRRSTVNRHRDRERERTNNPLGRSAEAALRRQEVRFATTVGTDLRAHLELAPLTDQVQLRPASSWLAAAALAQAASQRVAPEANSGGGHYTPSWSPDQLGGHTWDTQPSVSTRANPEEQATHQEASNGSEDFESTRYPVRRAEQPLEGAVTKSARFCT